MNNYDKNGGRIPIKNATTKGYLLAYDGDGIDLSYPKSKTRRGRVQSQMAHTITTNPHLGVVVIEGCENEN